LYICHGISTPINALKIAAPLGIGFCNKPTTLSSAGRSYLSCVQQLQRLAPIAAAANGGVVAHHILDVARFTNRGTSNWMMILHRSFLGEASSGFILVFRGAREPASL